MLFGREAVLPWMWVAGALVVVAIVVYAVWQFVVFAYGDDVREHLDETRAKGGSMFLAVLFWVSAAGNVVMFGWAAIVALTRQVGIREAVEFVPFWWVPVCFLLPSYFGNELIKWLQQRVGR